MKNLILIFVFSISYFSLFSQETSVPWSTGFYNWDSKLPEGKKFIKISHEKFVLYNNIRFYTMLPECEYLTKSDSLVILMELLGLDSTRKDSFIKEFKSEKVSIGLGMFDVDYKPEDNQKIETIMNNSRSIQEVLEKLEQIGYECGSRTLYLNGNNGKTYYTIENFYYTIKYNSYTKKNELSIMVPAEKWNTF
jgi:hypothetical protein